jgi:hypothetical protein
MTCLRRRAAKRQKLEDPNRGTKSPENKRKRPPYKEEAGEKEKEGEEYWD